MKRIFLTFVALAFGATLTFAQTNPQKETGEEGMKIEKLSNKAEMEGKKKIEITELPQAVQDAFKKSEYKNWEVAEIYEVQVDAETEGALNQEGNVDMSANTEEGVTYEINLITKDMQDELSDASESIQDEKEDMQNKEGVGVTTETVDVEVPALVLHYDKDGKLLKTEERSEEDNDDYKK